MTQLRRPIFAFLAVAISAVLFNACGSDAPTQVVVTPPVDTTTKVVPPPVVASVVVSGPTKLTVGRADTVKASPRTSAGVVVPGKTVAWVSSNTAVITVGAANGVVTAVGPGTATISGTIDGVVGTTSITATDASITSLAITPPAVVYIGASGQFAAVARDSVNVPVAIRSILWSTSNANVATISQTGLVTGVAAGTVTISAAVFGATAASTITVVPVPVASIVIAPYDSVLHFRFPRQVVATALDSLGRVLQRTFTYQSSNVDVATFDPFGLLTATGQGTDTVTVSAGGKSATARYFVPSDSGLYVATVGGVTGDPVLASIDIPNATFPTTFSSLVPANGISRFNFITTIGTYRVRTSTSADPARSTPALSGVALLTGITANTVPVTLGPPSTVVSIPMKPYTATIVAPATAAVGSTVTVSWTFDETTQPFSFFPGHPPTGFLYWGTANGPDLSGTSVVATVSVDPNTGISTFSASFVAPQAPGTVYVQVEGDGAVARLLYPIQFRGQALRSITIQ